jgi:NADH:ubiquinone oxidoreductase subunit 5 (subunit L)/multisubunit Na+/H+ antiporter MnhA subunit
MGGLRKKIPMTYWAMMIIGTIALTGVGIPGTLIGTAGFFSKDIIIEAPSWHGTAPPPDRLLAAVSRGAVLRVLFLAADVHDLPRQAARFSRT